VALITDGRFSGATRGACIGHASPEAAAGGPMAIVYEGDTIIIDIPARTVSLMVPEIEVESRWTHWQPACRRMTGYLGRYARLVSPASRGAVLEGGR
jgi:dihydroxy-acid dehydratase